MGEAYQPSVGAERADGAPGVVDRPRQGGAARGRGLARFGLLAVVVVRGLRRRRPTAGACVESRSGCWSTIGDVPARSIPGSAETGRGVAPTRRRVRGAGHELVGAGGGERQHDDRGHESEPAAAPTRGAFRGRGGRHGGPEGEPSRGSGGGRTR